MQCCVSGIFIPNPGSIPDPGSRFDKIPGTGSRIDEIPVPGIQDPDPHQRIYVFLTQKTDTKSSKIRSGMFVPDPRIWIFFHPGSATLIKCILI
jgi:hypothetical protein